MACMNNAREKKKTGLCFCGASEQTTLKARFCCCFYICDGRTPPNKIRRTSFPHSILAREQNEAALFFFFFCTLAKRHLLLFFFRRVLGTVNTLTLSAPPLLFSNFLFSPQIDFFFFSRHCEGNWNRFIKWLSSIIERSQLRHARTHLTSCVIRQP